MPDKRAHSKSCKLLAGLGRSPCTHTCWGSSPTSAASSQEWHGQEALPFQWARFQAEAWLRSSECPPFLVQRNRPCWFSPGWPFLIDSPKSEQWSGSFSPFHPLHCRLSCCPIFTNC